MLSNGLSRLGARVLVWDKGVLDEPGNVTVELMGSFLIIKSNL